ncbi:MAG: MFS transporter [Trueperaceae bacterium]
MSRQERGTPRRILPVVIAAQFAGTSLWFAGNAIAGDLQRAFELPVGAGFALTSAVQVGFIVGTLAYAAAMLADRWSPSRLFLASAVAAAASNLAVGWVATDLVGLAAFRFGTGFFLAGVYPVGMKLAADWFEGGLGTALGWLVGALVLGTAFPHLLAAFVHDLPWQAVLVGTSALAVCGGVAVAAWVPDGPYRVPSRAFRPLATWRAFRAPAFRSAALGYFGHMGELYAFWAFVPALIALRFGTEAPSTSLVAFGVIAVGAVGCVVGGYASLRVGSARVATASLVASGLACLASPFLVGLPTWAFVAVLMAWGVVVVSDSPQFSALVARAAPAEVRGSALTIVTSVGFAVTVPAIQGLAWLLPRVPIEALFLPLAIGPALGLAAMRATPREGA